MFALTFSSALAQEEEEKSPLCIVIDEFLLLGTVGLCQATIHPFMEGLADKLDEADSKSWRKTRIKEKENDIDAPFFSFLRGERQYAAKPLCQLIDEFVPLELIEEGVLFKCADFDHKNCEGIACLQVAYSSLYDNWLRDGRGTLMAGKDMRYDLDVKEGTGCAVDFYTKCFAVRFHPKYKVRDYWKPDQFNAFPVIHYKLQLTNIKPKYPEECEADACVLVRWQSLGQTSEEEKWNNYLLIVRKREECDSFSCVEIKLGDVHKKDAFDFSGEIAVTGRIQDEGGSGEYLDCGAIFCTNLFIEGHKGVEDGDYAVEISNRF